MTSLRLFVALGIVLATGFGLTRLLWPRHRHLPADLWFALAWLLGSSCAGGAMVVIAAAGAPGTPALTLVTIAGLGVAALGLHRTGERGVLAGGPPGLERPRWETWFVRTVIGTAVAWVVALTLNAHLGYDGTVVWHHKARLLAGAGGAPPLAVLAQGGREWAAPDYPLGVPAVSAWALLWMGHDDESLIKVVWTMWPAAILLAVAAIVRVSAGSSWAGAVAVLMLATAPRFLVGEGSLTSGYADAPYALAYLLAAWTVSQADWGADRRWGPVLTVLVAVLPWMKQEGLVGALTIGVVVAWHAGLRRAMALVTPALVVHGVWVLATMSHGAALGQAYDWPGLSVVWQRLPTIAGAYSQELVTQRHWGGLWLAVALGLLCVPRAERTRWMALLGTPLIAGAAVFALSAWGDVGEHLAVTVPRQLILLAPLLTATSLSWINKNILSRS